MIYYIEISGNSCTADVILNGLRIAKLKAEKTGSVQVPCNTELCGENNQLSVVVWPASMDLNILNSIALDGVIKKYANDTIVSPESGEIITSFSLKQRIEEIKAGPIPVNFADLVPFQIKASFDSLDAPMFVDRLQKAAEIKDPEKIKDWAIKFKEALKGEDTQSLFKWYEQKLLDYDIAYPDAKEPDNLVWFDGWMKRKIYPQRPFTDFTRSDIEPISWCNGRIWEVQLKGGLPLWSTIGKDGKRSKVQVFVGLVGNELKIVR